MDIEVFARIRPTTRSGEKPENDEAEETAKNEKGPAGNKFPGSFRAVYSEESDNSEIYKECVSPMLDIAMVGFNTAFICYGRTQSGKSYTLMGDNAQTKGVVQMTIHHLLESANRTESSGSTTTVTLEMFEIYDEVLRDLLKPGDGTNVDVAFNATTWAYVKNLSKISLTNEESTQLFLKSGWELRTNNLTDFGGARSKSSVFIQISISTNMNKYGYPHNSTLTFVDLPDTVSIPKDDQKLSKTHGMVLNKSAAAFNKLVRDLSENQEPNRVVDYSQSKLTLLLQEALGGNCKTKVLVHFEASMDQDTYGHFLLIPESMGKIRNYLLQNDLGARGLITLHRAKILSLQNQLGSSALDQPGSVPEDVAEDSSRLADANMSLREQCGYLQRQLEKLQVQLRDMLIAKQDLSSRLIASEEERLAVSTSLVELKMDSSRLRERQAQELFELKNRLMAQDSQVFHSESEKDRMLSDAQFAHNQILHLEQECNELANQFSNLKADYEALSKKYDKEVSKNRKLGLELLNLLNAETTLIKQRETLNLAGKSFAESDQELSKIRDIALGLTAEREKSLATEADRVSLRANLFGERDNFKKEVDDLKQTYDVQQERLQEKLKKMNDEIQRSRQVAQKAEKKSVEQDVELITKREMVKDLEREISKLNMKLKERNEEFRKRLLKYLDDITDFVEASYSKPDGRKKLLSTVNEITDDLRKTYTNREKQLSNAARSFRNQSQRMAKKHEQLLVAYRYLKTQVADKPNIDSGPSEHELVHSEEDLETANRKQLKMLGQQLREAKDELEILRMSRTDNETFETMKNHFKQMQEDSEKERAALLSTKALMEVQLAESQAYIKREIPRYKDEIKSLKRRLGMNDPSLYGEDFAGRGGYGVARSYPSY